MPPSLFSLFPSSRTAKYPLQDIDINGPLSTPFTNFPHLLFLARSYGNLLVPKFCGHRGKVLFQFTWLAAELCELLYWSFSNLVAFLGLFTLAVSWTTLYLQNGTAHLTYSALPLLLDLIPEALIYKCWFLAFLTVFSKKKKLSPSLLSCWKDIHSPEASKCTTRSILRGQVVRNTCFDKHLFMIEVIFIYPQMSAVTQRDSGYSIDLNMCFVGYYVHLF